MEEAERPVNPRILKWFQGRGISHETVIRGGIYSGRHLQIGGSKWEVVPDINGEIIVYPFFRNGKIINEKYRAASKHFYQKLGGAKSFWNADILDDPALQDDENPQPLIITEGENDALAAIEAGFPFVVSVPDGAPPALTNINDTSDCDLKFTYIALEWAALQKIKRITIATDADEPGKRLAEELVRRLGRVRCNFVTYPSGCKDLNEVLVSHGVDGVREVLTSKAKPYPISGIYKYRDLPPEPDLCPLSTGWGRFDEFIKPFYPAFMVVTGLAGSGKSTWTNQMVAQMNILHGLKVGIASFEMRINPFVTDTLFAVHREMGRRSKREDWVNDNFVFICPEPGEDNDNFNIDWLIEKAEAAVIRHGIRILLIDPWNEIEHAVLRRENFSDYTGRAIRALKRFGREFDCLVIVVAHPSKKGAEKQPEEITLYDISDSAHFANKADFGVVICRHQGSNETSVFIKKIRYQPETGVIGKSILTYSHARKSFSQ